STTANITARGLTITVTAANKVYDSTTTAAVTLSDDHVAGDSLTETYTSASFADKNVGTGKPVSVSGLAISGADAGNYALSQPATPTASITPADLSITAANVTMTYADGTTLNGSSGFTSTGLFGDDSISSVSLATNATLSGSGHWNAGTWTITPSSASG